MHKMTASRPRCVRQYPAVKRRTSRKENPLVTFIALKTGARQRGCTAIATLPLDSGARRIQSRPQALIPATDYALFGTDVQERNGRTGIDRLGQLAVPLLRLGLLDLDASQL